MPICAEPPYLHDLQTPDLATEEPIAKEQPGPVGAGREHEAMLVVELLPESILPIDLSAPPLLEVIHDVATKRDGSS